MKVEQIGSNMTQVSANGMTILISYKTPVACHIQGKGYYKTAKYWSVTTSKHISKWLRSNDYSEVTEKPQDFFDNLLEG